MDYRQYIICDSGICGGAPVIRGTRVTLRTVLASLAEGATSKEIVDDFPSLSDKSVRAVIAFAATCAEEDMPVRGVPVMSPCDLQRFRQLRGSLVKRGVLLSRYVNNLRFRSGVRPIG